MIRVRKFVDKYRVKILGIRFYVKRRFEPVVERNYAKHTERLKQKFGKEPIKVGFLVRENAKWSYESLYRLMEQDPDFEPLVVIKDDDFELARASNNLPFFKDYNHCVIRTLREYRKLGVDILFYEQPWYDICDDFTPDGVSAYSLTYYVPYAVESEAEPDVHGATSSFLKALTASFCFSEKMSQALRTYGIHNTHVVGHPRMDAYMTPEAATNPWRSEGKVRIIYAPHHSFGYSLLKQASWEWSGEHILKLAREHQDTTEWIFKPHPRFQYELGRLLQSEKKAQEVMDAWAAVSQLYNRGNYFDLFKTADVMISDCISFNIEWLPSHKPFIRLRAHYPDTRIFEAIEYYSEPYYHADSVADIDRYFDMLVNRHEDPNREARAERATEIQTGVASHILDIIKARIAPNSTSQA